MKKIQFLLVAYLFSLSFVFAQNKGLEIAKKAEKADLGFKDSKVKLKMVLRNKQGQESTRYMVNKTLEQTKDGDKSMIIFNSPKDVKGTAVLTFTHKKGADDQWLYLPAVKRVKRISSSNKSGPFMGSEFAYEDLSSNEIEKYKYKYVKNVKYHNANCAIVEQTPLDPKSGYKRRLVYYNTEKNYRIEKMVFYDRKNTKLKTLTYHSYKKYLSKHWRANRFKMVNHQTSKETELFFEGYTFKTGLTSKSFTQNALIRAGK